MTPRENVAHPEEEPTYETQAIDEFVINWNDDGFGSGWQGYLTSEFKDASDIYGAGEYVLEYGTMPN